VFWQHFETKPPLHTVFCNLLLLSASFCTANHVNLSNDVNRPRYSPGEKSIPCSCSGHTFPFATFYTGTPPFYGVSYHLLSEWEIYRYYFFFTPLTRTLFFSWRRLSFKVCKVLDNRGRPLLLTVSFFWGKTCFQVFLPSLPREFYINFLRRIFI